jgi:hypothetical protein
LQFFNKNNQLDNYSSANYYNNLDINPLLIKLNNKLILKNDPSFLISLLSLYLLNEKYDNNFFKLINKIPSLFVEYKFLNSDPIFSGNKVLNVYESHRWVIQSLPAEFEILATSEYGIETFKHTQKPIYGFQFHPENMTEEGKGDEVFLKVLNLLAI